jgi:hypothetical protein
MSIFTLLIITFLNEYPLQTTIAELRNGARAAYSARMFHGSLDLAQPTDDEHERREAMLARLVGNTRRIDHSSADAPGPAAPLQLPTEEIHPSVLEYLRTLGM